MTEATKRYKKVEHAMVVISKLLLMAEKRFKNLKAPEMMKDVWNGKCYINGLCANKIAEGVDA